MKSTILILVMAVSVMFSSCNQSGGPSETAKKNIEVNKSIMKAYEAGEFDKMKDYIAADAIDHGGENGDVKGLDAIVAQMKVYRASMPDMKSETLREIGDDEYVFTWARVNGTMGGKMTTMTSLDVTKFKDAKAIEHWVYMDPNEMMKMMMSSMPKEIPISDTVKTGMAASPDTTKK